MVFRYEEGGRNILNLVDFHVEPGRTIALVGPTGAGKTTIISLLSRFYDVSEGSVTIDGYDVRDVTLESLRRQMGVMLQDHVRLLRQRAGEHPLRQTGRHR